MKLGRSILGRLLKLRRTQLKRTVYDVAQDIGVSHNAISYFETGQLAVPARRIGQFALAYRLDRQDLWAWYLVTKLHDEGVSLDELEDILPAFNRLGILLGWSRGSADHSGRVLADEPRPESPVSVGNHAELQRDFVRSIQTLIRMRKRGDFPVDPQ